MKTFIGNGYPRAFVRSATAPRTPREPSDDDDNDTEKPPIVHNYVAGVSERIRKVCRDFNIRTVFRSGPTLRNLLTKAKDPSRSTNNRTSSTRYCAPLERCTSAKLSAG